MRCRNTLISDMQTSECGSATRNNPAASDSRSGGGVLFYPVPLMAT